jgi:hypothetical protein
MALSASSPSMDFSLHRAPSLVAQMDCSVQVRVLIAIERDAGDGQPPAVAEAVNEDECNAENRAALPR